MVKCSGCHGLGYREFEAGLIRLVCKDCEGMGIIVEKPIEKRKRGRPKRDARRT